MDTVFDDRIQFPSLFRTVASTRVLNTAIVQLLKHFGWTWVGIITSDEKLSTSEELRQEIVRSGSCIEFVFVSPQKITEHTFENLDRHSAGVIILVFTLEHLLHFVSFLGKSNIMSRKVFILSSDFLPQKQSNGKEDTLWALNGSLFFTLGNGHIPGLKEFLYKASPAIYPNNRLLNELWLVLFKCYHAGYTESKRICKKNFSMESLSPFDYDVNNFRLTYSLYTAVYSLAHALHNMYSAAMKKQKLERLNLNTFYPWKTPQSVCIANCYPGYRKAPQRGKPACCYDCVPCSEGEISNMTDMENCLRCPEDEWPDELRVTCVQRTVHFLSIEDSLGETLVSLTLIFCAITAAVLGIFIIHRDTAIVRANNRDLSYTLLTSLMLSFLCSLLFIGQPVKLTCLVQQAAFSIIFTVAVSSVVAKTITVFVAFTSTKPGSKFRRWAGRSSNYIVLLCSLGEVGICTVWLIHSPPFPERNTETEVGKLILQCNVGSALAYYVALAILVSWLFSALLLLISKEVT
ncbi:hypothetical protein FKM82_015981 [Ascaphus truei]